MIIKYRETERLAVRRYTAIDCGRFAYDDLDQLISVSRDGVEVERYRYDAFGRRSVIETANDNAVFERTALVNDGSDRTIDLVLVDDGVGGLTTQIQNRYTHGGQVDEPLSLEVFASDGSLDQSYTYHADHLGSIRFVTDSVGTIVNAYEYDSYGRPGFELEQVSQPFRYTGREWDKATELYHYRARQYDPETGRFLQEDPIGMLIEGNNSPRYIYPNPDYGHYLETILSLPKLGYGPEFNLNIYLYVDANPVNMLDPSGHFGIAAGYASRAKKGAITAAVIARHSMAVATMAARRNVSRATQFVRSNRKEIGKCAAGLLSGLTQGSNAADYTHISPDDSTFQNCEQAGSIAFSVGKLIGDGVIKLVTGG